MKSLFSDHYVLKPRKTTGKSPNIRKLNNILLNKPLGKRESVKGNLKIYIIQWNENTTYQDMWETTKAALREKFIVLKCLH